MGILLGLCRLHGRSSARHIPKSMTGLCKKMLAPHTNHIHPESYVRTHAPEILCQDFRFRASLDYNIVITILLGHTGILNGCIRKTTQRVCKEIM